MKKRNKIFAIVLAIVIVASVFVVGTMADTKTTSISIAVSDTELSAGETATVTVKATTNYPVATASIPVFYDKTLVSISNATAVLTGYDNANVTTDSEAVDLDRVYNNTSIDSSKYGFVLVNYIGGANDTVAESITDATILTFTITALSDVSGEALINCVSATAKTDENVAGMLYFGTTTSGTTITSIPENVENIDIENASTSVAVENGTAQIVAKTGTTAVVDTTNKYIYGITPGDSVENYFTVNNGTYALVESSQGSTNGTGAKIQVKNAGGDVVDTYTVIIFGDLNGDANVDGTDSQLIMQKVAGSSTLDIVQTMASNVNADANVDGTDSQLIMQKVAGSGTLSVNPYA